MSRRLLSAAVACGLVVAAACGNPPARSSIPAPDDWPGPAESGSPADPTGLLVEPPTTTAPQTAVAPQTTGTGSSGAVGGLIAAAGPTGLRLMSPDGSVIADMFSDQVVAQPTWSRDGRRLVATLIDPSSGAPGVTVIDVATGETTTAVARRPYFFYTWSHDGSRLAALGPGSPGLTALDILDGAGTPTAANSLQGASVYVAWEPDGRRLMLHVGSQLVLIGDPDSPDDYQDFGTVGSDFQAPAWVPGSGDFLYVDSGSQIPDGALQQGSPGQDAPAGPQLLRRNADSAEITNLGPVSGFTLMAVHPDGEQAALALPPHRPSTPAAIDGIVQASFSPAADLAESGSPTRAGSVGAAAQSSAGAVQIVDLVTGERLTVLDQPGLWLEWSPDGGRLLMAILGGTNATGPSLSWHVWDGVQSQELAGFTPTAVFLQNYLAFSDQYTETPRLWSPDGAAIAFGALIDGGAAVAVARLDDMGRSTSLGPGDVAFWSPDPDSNHPPESQ